MPELEHWQVQLNVINVVTVAPGEDPVAVAIANLEAYAAANPDKGPFSITGQGSKRVYEVGEYAPAMRQVAAASPQAGPPGGQPNTKQEYGVVGQQPNGAWVITFADGHTVPMPPEYLPW
jgi:hypothetical protein